MGKRHLDVAGIEDLLDRGIEGPADRPLLARKRLDPHADDDGTVGERLHAEPLEIADDGRCLIRIASQRAEGVLQRDAHVIDILTIGNPDVGHMKGKIAHQVGDDIHR
ncbi:hypothetical protein D3C72_2192500 [compost metagenome]